MTKIEVKKFDNQLYSPKIRVYNVFERNAPPEWEVDSMILPFSIFLMVLDGEKTIHVHDKTYQVKAGDLLMIPAQNVFSVYKSKYTSLSGIEIFIRVKKGALDLFSLWDLPHLIHLDDHAKREQLYQIWSKLDKLWNTKIKFLASQSNGTTSPNLDHLVDIAQFNGLCNQWLSKLLNILKPFAVQSQPAIDPRLEQVSQYIQRHLHEDLSLSSLAKQVYISESHLRQLFRQQYKISPMKYVRNIRLQRACELLLNTDLPIKDISEMVGFVEQSQLSRMFRQILKMSPNEYRQKGGLSHYR